MTACVDDYPSVLESDLDWRYPPASPSDQAEREAHPDLAAIQMQTRYRVVLHRQLHPAVPALRFEHPEQAAAFFAPLLRHEPREVMLSAGLDSRNRLIGWQQCFAGGLSRTTAEPRLILQGALLMNAAGVMVAHNHPSGDPQPSPEDREFTQRLRQASEVLGVKLVDHLIVGGDGTRWVSLRRRQNW